MKPVLARFPDSDGRRRRHRRRLRSLALVPTLMTLANLLCGFAAIHFALRAVYDLGAGLPATTEQALDRSLLERMLPSFLSIGAGLIILGMIFDLLDGLLARVTRSTTNFGGQLDSLADIVTFGVAPATLMVALMTRELAVESILPSPISSSFLGRLTWISAAIYVAFTAIRLARFNVEHARADFDYRTFRGIPSPGAACVIAALILCQDQPELAAARNIIVYSMPVVAVLVALLMVSRIPYRRFHRAYFLGRKPFGRVITFVVVFAIFWSHKAPVFLALILWYAASGPFFELTRFLRGRVGTATYKSDSEQYERERKRA